MYLRNEVLIDGKREERGVRGEGGEGREELGVLTTVNIYSSNRFSEYNFYLNLSYIDSPATILNG